MISIGVHCALQSPVVVAGCGALVPGHAARHVVQHQPARVAREQPRHLQQPRGRARADRQR